MRYGALIALSILCVVVVSAVGSGASVDARQTSLAEEFDRASREYGVPRDLLLAMGYVNARWEMPPPSTSDYESGDPEGRGNYGVMALVRNPSRDTLGKASSLTGLSVEALKNDRVSNVNGGAAVLADLAGAQKPSDLGGWYDAVSDYGGGPPYAEQVYEVLKDGASATTTTGEHLKLAPRDVDVPALYSAQATGDYPRSRWYGNGGSNYTESRREPTYDINTIVIHVTQGSWSSAINYFATVATIGLRPITPSDPPTALSASRSTSRTWPGTRAGGLPTRIASASNTRDIRTNRGGSRTRCTAPRPGLPPTSPSNTTYPSTAST